MKSRGGQYEELLGFRTQGKRAELLQSLRVAALEPEVSPADPVKVLEEDIITLCLKAIWKDVVRNVRKWIICSFLVCNVMFRCLRLD